MCCICVPLCYRVFLFGKCFTLVLLLRCFKRVLDCKMYIFNYTFKNVKIVDGSLLWKCYLDKYTRTPLNVSCTFRPVKSLLREAKLGKPLYSPSVYDITEIRECAFCLLSMRSFNVTPAKIRSDENSNVFTGKILQCPFKATLFVAHWCLILANLLL